MTDKKTDLISGIRASLSAMRDSDYGEGISVFESSYGAPSASPFGLAHPRVMLNAQMLPALREAMADEQNAAALSEYRALLADGRDGTLPPSYPHENGRGSKGGVYNWDGRLLAAIEARALEYLLTGDEYYGYSAILGILNYIRTLSIEWIAGDQFREYGITMYVAALVYDWCYPLLGEDERRRITLGVEHRLCRGYCGDPAHAMGGGVKMEMGCPPVRQGAITGHGNEATLLRDYLAFSIAIADEHPDWWQLVAGRIEHEYIPVREIYYASSCYPQGRYYAAFRFMFDLWSACLFLPIYGRNPYPVSDMRRTLRTMIAEETDDGLAFGTGDASMTVLGSELCPCLVLGAYLFRDGGFRAAAEYLGVGVSTFNLSATGLSPVTALIAASRGVRATDRHADIPLIYRTRGYFNQYVSRSAFGSGNPVTLMKAGGRFTSNHEHSNAGHFQIWYKGYLSGDTGLYQGYGSDNHVAFHMQSIAHNVPLVYNPAYRDKELMRDGQGRPTNRERYWYSGGQRHPIEIATLDAWHSPRFVFADSPLMQSEMRDGKPVYSYVSSDITRAYEPDTVAYLRRSMITSFATDGSVPMVFFVFDRIESVDPSFKKTFLLQINGEEAPVLRGNVAVTENGEGRLTLTAITPQVLTAIGGVGQNYLINGIQCKPPREPARTWGRLEISPIGERTTDHMLQVITVSDRGVDAPAALRVDCGGGCEGAYLAGSAAIFRRSREDLGSDIAFTLPAPAYTYFSGLNEGEFEVTDATGATVATLSVGENKNLAAAHLPEGRLLLRKL